MTTSPLQQFLGTQPLLREFIIPLEEGSKWGRVVCKWKEKGKNSVGQDRVIEHIMTPLINMKTGEIYDDCTKKKIYAKFLAHTVARPLLSIIKTLYHVVFPISLLHIGYQTYQEGKEDELTHVEIAKNFGRNCVKSLADIVRTPVYGIVLTIVSLAAFVIGPFAPKTVYNFREITGKLIASLHRNPKFVSGGIIGGDQFACLTTGRTLQMMNTVTKSKQHADTVYSDKTGFEDYEDDDYFGEATVDQETIKYLRGITNFARGEILFRRKERALFNDCGQLLDPNVAYTSRSYGDVQHRNINPSS